MADPLKLLREYALDKKPIRERDQYICFGEVGFPRDVKTNFAIYGKPNEYYTLEALYNFWQKKDMIHMDYVKESVNKFQNAIFQPLSISRTQLVSRPDRNDIIGYLSDRNAKPPASVDMTAAVPVPMHMGRHVNESSSDGASAAKRLRSDDDERMVTDQEQLGALLNESLGSPNKAKADRRRPDAHRHHARVAGRKSTDDVPGGDLAGDTHDTSHERHGAEHRHKERVHRNRASCMNATKKNFQQSIFPVLKQLKERENAQSRITEGDAELTNTSAGAALSAKQTTSGARAPGTSQQVYSRYDQERFQKQRDEFDVDPSATFAGKDGAIMNRLREPGASSGALARQQSTGGGSNTNGNLVTPAMTITPSTAEQNAIAAGAKRKRPSRTPIIVVPASGTALISMLNAKDILQDLRYVSNEQKKAEAARRETEILVQRKKPDGSTVPFRVVDNATRLSNDEFDRIVAVFVQGPAWQFKNWRPSSNPPDVFQRHCPFYLCHDEMQVDQNVSKWAVSLLKISKLKRHLDRAVLMQFWSILDRFMMKNYPQLRF